MQIGNYQTIDKIAEGGMGVIYKAVDQKTDNYVAIKTLKSDVDIHSETFLRFKKEAELLESLNHPHIIRFINFIEKENQLYIVTEYLEGFNFKNIIQNKQYSIDQKISIVKDISDALHYVHSNGIIHRDVKPSNVMITIDKKVKVLDFGVANLMDFQQFLSNKDSVVGSFAYMSPEQSGILKRNIDNRSDLYSLGILFYEAITYQLPYKSKEIGELMHQHIAKHPDEPLKLISELSPIINKIILKLMKKDPDDRYQTAYGLYEDLKLYISLNETQKVNFYLELGKKDRLKNLNYRTSLIGRKREISHLLNHLNDTILEKGFASLIIGKSGSGKSRILQEIQKYTASKNALYIPVNSNPSTQNNPYWPIIDNIEKVIDLVYKLPETQKIKIFEQLKNVLGKEGTILSKLIPGLEPILGVYDENIKFEKKESDVFFENIKEFYLNVSSSTLPMVMVFDDIHYWDEGTISFFEYFKSFLYESSVYFVLATREEETLKIKEFHEKLINWAKNGEISILNLKNFSYDEVVDLITEIFGDIELGLEELASRLHEVTIGNPLLIVENVKTLVEENVISQKNERWLIDINKLVYFRFSSSIADKILNHLLKIRQTTTTMLKFASILGKEFTFNLLFHIISKKNPQLKRENLLDNLTEAVSSGLIFENLSQRGEVIYSFAHDKVQETLINQLDEHDSKEIHRFAAEIIENNYEGSDKIYRLAFHYLKGEQKQKAYHSNVKAGRKAIASFSFKLAGNFYYNALEIIKQFAKTSKKAILERLKISMEIVELNIQLSVYDKNVELLTEILSLAEDLNDKEMLAKIYFYLGRCFYFMGAQDKALPYYKKVIVIAEKLNLTEFLAISYTAIGRASCYMAKFKESVVYMKKGINLLMKVKYGEMYALELLGSLGVLGQSYGYIGYKKEALQVISYLDKHFGDKESEVYKIYILFYKGAIYSLIGEHKRAEENCLKAIEMAKEMKNMTVEIYSMFFLGRSYGSVGKFEKAIRLITKAVQLGNKHNINVGFFLVIFYLIENYIFIGNNKLAKETLGNLEKYLVKADPNFTEQWKNRLFALLELSSATSNIYYAKEIIEKAILLTNDMGKEYRYHHAKNLIFKSFVLFKMNHLKEAEDLYENGINILQELDLKNEVHQFKGLKTRFCKDYFLSMEDTFVDLEATSTFTKTYTQTEFSYQRQLNYLLKLSEQLAVIHEMEELLEKIIHLAIEVSGAERGLLFLFDDSEDSPKNKELIIKAKLSVDKKEEQTKIVYSKKVLEKTIHEAKGQLVMDAEKELEDDYTVISNNMKSIITLPLLVSGKILGAIYLDNRQVKGLFSEENFELLKAFATEAAISIENARLYKAIQEKARIEQEMEIAKDIQESILPNVKSSEEYEISAFMRTASEVGGDYYDFNLKKEPYFGVFGDVSGHGLKSGLIMMMAEVAFNFIMKDEVMKKKDLTDLYQKINLTLYENIQLRLAEKSSSGRNFSSMYMTFRLFRFDKEGNFEIFGNDHAEPFICRGETGDIQTIESKGFLIGIMEEATLNAESEKFKLNKNDLLVLFSDGITEAKSKKTDVKNSEEYFYGEEKLYEVVKQNRDKKLNVIIDEVIKSVDNWMVSQDDDITICIIKKR